MENIAPLANPLKLGNAKLAPDAMTKPPHRRHTRGLVALLGCKYRKRNFYSAGATVSDGSQPQTTISKMTTAATVQRSTA